MSYQQVGINQGDSIFFYDTSVGDIASRDWYFPGGSPVGGTAWGVSVKYNTPNTNGYDASILVTDTAGVTGFSLGSNIIVVAPENFNVSFTINPTSSLMDQTVLYQSTGTAASGLSGAGYVWNIPGLGATSGLSLDNVSYSVPEWYALVGTYAGAANSYSLQTATLTMTSNLGNVSNSGEYITFYKLGPLEQINYGHTGSYGVSGPYYTPIVENKTSGNLSLGGNNIVISIDQNYPSSAWNNSYFHSTDEAVYYYPNTTDFSASYAPIKFKFIWNTSAINLLGYTAPSIDRLTYGNYIITGDVSANFSNYFWLTDYTTGGNILSSYSQTLGSVTRKWNDYYIQSLLSNTYHLSTSSKYIENGGFNSGSNTPVINLASVVGYNNHQFSYNWNGYNTYSNQVGVCVPSSLLLKTFCGVNNPVVDVNINLYNSSNSLITSVNAVLSSSNNPGNSEDGGIILAQSGGYNNALGIAELMNTAIATAGLTDYLLVEESYIYGSYENGKASGYPPPYDAHYDVYEFHGLRVSVLQTVYAGQEIDSIELVWGSGYNSFLVSYVQTDPQAVLIPQNVVFYPFAGSGSSVSWTGLNQKLYRNPNTNPYFRGWKLGGSL